LLAHSDLMARIRPIAAFGLADSAEARRFACRSSAEFVE